MGKDYSANDMRSMSMNSNSSHFQAAMDNHSNQMNSNNDAYWSSRSTNDFFGLEDYYGEYVKRDIIKDIRPIAEKAVLKFRNYKDNIEEIEIENTKENEYNHLVSLIENFKLTVKEVECVLQFEEFNELNEEMLEFLFVKMNNFELLYKVSKYKHLNKWLFDIWIDYTLTSMNKDYINFPVNKRLIKEGIDNVKEAYIRQITEEYKKESTSNLYDASISYAGLIVSYVLDFIRSCVINDNLELAKKIQDFFKLNKELFNSLEYKKNDREIMKFRSLYNMIPNRDEWVNFLLSIGAKASTNEMTFIYRKIYEKK